MGKRGRLGNPALAMHGPGRRRQRHPLLVPVSVRVHGRGRCITTRPRSFDTQDRRHHKADSLDTKPNQRQLGTSRVDGVVDPTALMPEDRFVHLGTFTRAAAKSRSPNDLGAEGVCRKLIGRGEWSDTPTVFTYQWQENAGGVWVDIDGATSGGPSLRLRL